MVQNGFKSAVQRAWGKCNVRFLFVGAANTGSGYIISSLGYYVMHAAMRLELIILICTVVNVTISYTTNKLLVFRTRGNILAEYFRFYLVSAVPIAISFVLLPVAINRLKMNPYVAIAVVTGIGVVASFLGHKFFSFRQSDATESIESNTAEI